MISEALALRLELEAPPLEEVGGWSIDLNRSSLNKNRNEFQGRRFVITQNQRGPNVFPQIAIAIGVLTSNRGGGEGDDQL